MDLILLQNPADILTPLLKPITILDILHPQNMLLHMWEVIPNRQEAITQLEEEAIIS